MLSITSLQELIIWDNQREIKTSEGIKLPRRREGTLFFLLNDKFSLLKKEKLDPSIEKR